MAETLIVNAIVLRSVNYRDFDRMVTLFSLEHGKIAVGARGAHRQKSAFAAATTQFCTGQYALEEKNGKYSMRSFLADEAFYALREQPDRLSFAMGMAALCEELVQPMQPNEMLYALLLQALTYLCYDGGVKPENIAVPFLMRAMRICGHEVMLSRCATCGGRIVDARFDAAAGGAVCALHASPMCPVLTREDADAMLKADKGEFAPAAGGMAKPFYLLLAFVTAQLEREFAPFEMALQLSSPDA